MPDATFDWDAAMVEARKAAEAQYDIDQPYLSPDGYSAFLDGWDAAMAWVKKTALLRMLGGGSSKPAPKKPKRSQGRRRARARQVACPTCGAGVGVFCTDKRDGSRMKGTHIRRRPPA